uniref:Uncharacterized protein n=1 Tax=Oryza barthii TaxID=65489 RepID=A0A0D3F734_9ORYZ
MTYGTKGTPWEGFKASNLTANTPIIVYEAGAPGGRRRVSGAGDGQRGGGDGIDGRRSGGGGRSCGRSGGGATRGWAAGRGGALDFLHNSNAIYVMRDGVVAQSGRYHDLLRAGGYDFAVLVAAHESSMELVESVVPGPATSPNDLLLSCQQPAVRA